MSRFAYMILLLVIVGCSYSAKVQNKDEIIEVGDLVDDVKDKLRKWGSNEALFACAIAIKGEHETQSEFLERAEEIRRRDDFCDHPYYWVRPKVAAVFSARDGKLVAIGRTEVLGPYAGNRTSESGFRSVDSTGRFNR